ASYRISLWFHNDESLYNLAKRELQSGHIRHQNRATIAANILDQLRQAGITSSPDGDRYTVTSIRNALVGL
ncbi:hypothetical protein, partial [Streptococcus pneumoniae]|uniref:hypothetical protein n=1 Tax=Streptococcus pneumoniae TaxID=1313 RepID=UPI001E562109